MHAHDTSFQMNGSDKTWDGKVLNFLPKPRTEYLKCSFYNSGAALRIFDNATLLGFSKRTSKPTFLL